MPSLPSCSLPYYSLLICLAITPFGSCVCGTNSPVRAESPTDGALFADPALEAVVRQRVLAKRDNAQPLTADDVAEISRLVAPGRKLHSLAGLEHCRSLLLVDFADNAITDLTPLTELKRLQSVTLAGNQISDISPLQGLAAVQLLDLSRNQVETLGAVAKMPNLRTLYVADNRLSDIAPLASLTKMSSLDLAGNAIVDLTPITRLTGLTTLETSDNPVRSIECLTAIPNLSMLIMPNNPIESLDPLIEMCAEDARTDRRFAPYLQVYLNLQSEPASQWQAAIETLQQAGVKVHDYRRPTTEPAAP